MVVSVAALQHLDGHSEKTGGLPEIRTALHGPCCGGVRRTCGVILSGPFTGKPAAFTAAAKPLRTGEVHQAGEQAAGAAAIGGAGTDGCHRTLRRTGAELTR
jgi:hypothetical protein